MNDTVAAVVLAPDIERADATLADTDSLNPGLVASGVVADVQTAVHRLHVQSLLDHVQAQPLSQQAGEVEVTSGLFTSGETGSIVEFPSSNQGWIYVPGPQQQVFVYQSSTGVVEYYLIKDGVLGRQLVPGDILELEVQGTADWSNWPVRVSVDAESGDLHLARGFSPGGMPIRIDSATAEMSIRNAGVVTTYNLATGASLLDATRPVGGNLSAYEIYQYYRNTPEGRYNRGEGGAELFEAYMPERSLLDAAGRVEYDAQLERILTHVQNKSFFASNGDLGPGLDPSLQFLIASGLMETIGNNPELVGRVLGDIDSGWRVSLDGTGLKGDDGGRYSTRKPIFHSNHASITFGVNALLRSYVDPHDRDELIGHEIAHSLDAYNSGRPSNANINTTDGMPSRMDTNDQATLLRIRAEFFADFNPDDKNTWHELDDYAFKNRKEFWAEISQYFLSGQYGAETIHAASPELYGVLSRFYDIQYPGLVPA